MWGLPRGMVIGNVDGDSRFSEAEHFWKCEFCSGLFDMRDLGAVLDAPHPTCDRVGLDGDLRHLERVVIHRYVD